MKFAEIAGNDISNIFKNRFMRVSVIAIIIVPMLYSLCYLAAFWNPYSRLDQLPVAVLNLDSGAKLDNQTVNYGSQVVNTLKQNHDVKWSFIVQDDLKDGLASTDYYSLFTIPEDFSQKIVSAKSGEPKVGEIIYTSNEAKNFLASQISGNVETELKEKVSSSVTKEYTQAAFEGLYNAKEGFSEAADGSSELYNGISTLDGKLPALNEGIEELSSGSSDLSSGLNSLNQNMPLLTNGSARLASGANAVQSQLPVITGNIQTLFDKVNPLVDGLEELAVKIPSLVSGSENAKGSTASLHNTAVALTDGTNEISVGLDNLIGQTSSTTDFDNAIADIKALVNSGADSATVNAALDNLLHSYSTGLNTLNVGLQDVKTGANDISGGLEQLKATLDPSASHMSDGSPTFSSGISLLADGMKDLENSAGNLGNGAYDLYESLSLFSTQLPSIVSDASNLVHDVDELNQGLDEAAGGVNQLYNGSISLSGGMDSLKNKMPDLTSGVSTLKGGAEELHNKLADGVTFLDKSLVNSSETMAEYISNPVSMSNEPLNPVPNYGTGFAPYFIPLSLWVGAILMFFIISPKADPRFGANSSQSVIGKYLSYAFIGLFQALMVGAIVLALGLQPNHIGLYFFTIIIMSLTSIAIVQMLISLLGDAGRLVAIVLLILQLTADAGTFPLELVPNFFKVLNPFMPFTYCVTALREAISGTNIILIWQCLGVIAIFLGISLSVCILFKKRAEKLLEKMDQMRVS